jgi:hypothetical protein
LLHVAAALPDGSSSFITKLVHEPEGLRRLPCTIL